MIYEDYKQLRTYSRYDGVYLAILWAASLACFVGSAWQSFLGTFSSLLILSTPFFVAYRLRIFREEGREGTISFSFALMYCLQVFMNSAFLFSLLQWAYMSFLDNGTLFGIASKMLGMPQYQDFIRQMGLSTEDYLTSLREIFEPLTLATTGFIYELLLGAIVSFPVAAVMARRKQTK